MPELAAGVTLRRAYRKTDAGPPCTVCSQPLVKALAAAGETTHATCSATFDDMLDALRRAITRRKVDGAPAPAAAAAPAPATTPGGFATPSSPHTITSGQRSKLHATFADVGITLRDRKLAFCSDTVFRPITSTNELSQNEAKQVIDALERIRTGDA